MNERIRELAQEAYTYALIHDNSYHGEVYNKKFAELIVRECCVVILADPRLGDVRSATRGCARSIKEHFGVEE